jgi:hypothetical protein
MIQYDTGSAQYVVLAWLMENAGGSREDAANALPPLEYVQRVDEAKAMGITDPDAYAAFMEADAPVEPVEALKADIDAAIDRFAALSPEEQRGWLEANWEALRAGELTLEDLP